MRPLPKTYLKAVLNLGIAVILLLLLVFLLPRVIVFFMPFVIGWVIALIANPLVHFFEDKLKVRRKAGTAFVIISVIALVVLAGYLIGAKVVNEAVGLVNELPQMWDALEEDFRIRGLRRWIYGTEGSLSVRFPGGCAQCHCRHGGKDGRVCRRSRRPCGNADY